MTIYSYHFAKVPFFTAVKAFHLPPKTRGLIQKEFLARMTLGSPIISPERMQLRNLTMFAAWESEEALDEFLTDTKLGRSLATGWHVRMEFLRRWGAFKGFDHLPETVGEQNPDAPVVAVTLARMKPLHIPRFLRWGRPVEKLVRDHSGQTLASAGIRYPNTISTFTVWKSQQEMTNMVRGHSDMTRPKRHSDAMAERERKGFHFEFTTLRFRPVAESGSWEGRTNIIPVPNHVPKSVEPFMEAVGVSP